MSDEEIVERLRKRLNEEGRPWNLEFEVSNLVQLDGEWTKLFIKSNAIRKNAAAERQIISDVEEEVIDCLLRDFTGWKHPRYWRFVVDSLTAN